MLTPVDIQQKKFHVGLGYDKKDVNTFFESVSDSYEQLYRSNAELKEKVNSLNDTLQHYKTKETSLNKSLLRAEKDTEETLTKASKEAKNIIRDAKNQANTIIGDTEIRLEKMKDEMALLEARYAAYKSNFCTLLKKQFEFLGIKDFDPKAYIDDRAWGLLEPTVMQGSSTASSSSMDNSFGAFNGDPQMRDESTLGGGLTGGFGSGDLTSSSAVYTQNLAQGENFVDPFAPKQEKEYDPFEKRNVDNESKMVNLKVANEAEDRKKFKRATVGSAEASAAQEKAKVVAQGVKLDNRAPESETKENVVPNVKKEQTVQQEKQEVKQEVKQEEKQKITTIPIVSAPVPEKSKTDSTHSKRDKASSEEENFIGEVENNRKAGAALLGEEYDDADLDDDGFEFV